MNKDHRFVHILLRDSTLEFWIMFVSSTGYLIKAFNFHLTLLSDAALRPHRLTGASESTSYSPGHPRSTVPHRVYTPVVAGKLHQVMSLMTCADREHACPAVSLGGPVR
jgi:hypothetical protein